MSGIVTCTACKRSVTLSSHGRCAVCGATQGGPQAPAPRASAASALVVQAQAEISWGRDRRQVRQKLIAGGVSERDADRVIGAAVEERGRQVRSLGIRDLVIGGIVLAASVVVLVAVMSAARDGERGGGTRGGGRGMALLLVGIVVGGWRTATGVSRLYEGAEGDLGSSVE